MICLLGGMGAWTTSLLSVRAVFAGSSHPPPNGVLALAMVVVGNVVGAALFAAAIGLSWSSIGRVAMRLGMRRSGMVRLGLWCACAALGSMALWLAVSGSLLAPAFVLAFGAPALPLALAALALLPRAGTRSLHPSQ